MKICFIGLGSIGHRHLKNIINLANKRLIPLTVDALRSDQPEHEVEGIDRQFCDYNDMDKCYDIIFICNPTFLHYETLIKVRDRGKFFFIEKPIFNSCMNNLNEFIDDPNKYYIACPMRYCATLEYIKKNIKISDVLSCRSICSSYLPDWRKGVDYRNIYSAHKAQGGGVIVDIIHEMDYLIHLFGIPKEIRGFSGKFSNLEIDSDDLAVYIARYENILVELHLDYFGRLRKREIELYTNDDVLIGDLDNDTLLYKKNGKTIEFCEDINQRYIRELEHVLDIYEEKIANDNNILLANDILRIAQSIEEINHE